ncbi:hypothetical protein [Acetobacter lovaniensis]|uniref:Uncharacterized protein n=1 Tax=Acetobacter lovaniensis TaxID=104100 RepID=A0A841QIY6_9PROT|nr:hypothetical protein [Acetobacter lovaniensis]MBB6458386.1 hypothetical protein [Acetobacter lovaniensis]NHN82612.1 hypothetical protein [Acetobacter lovaniensis]GBQ66443.1 hypothetical protein AA0474_1127 [Acetobacter lovaniensis NRIC 0474]
MDKLKEGTQLLENTAKDFTEFCLKTTEELKTPYELLCEKIDAVIEEHNELIEDMGVMTAEDKIEVEQSLKRYDTLCDIKERYEEDNSVDILMEFLTIY